MSGGSLDYACWKIEQIAGEIKDRARTPLHRAFAKHLMQCANAAHDLEWMLSGDISEGDEIAAIRAVLPKKAVLKQVIEEAHEAKRELEEELKNAETV